MFSLDTPQRGCEKESPGTSGNMIVLLNRTLVRRPLHSFTVMRCKEEDMRKGTSRAFSIVIVFSDFNQTKF